MSTPTEIAAKLYDALARHDALATHDLLTDDFEGTVSAGMPLGVGGHHHGPTAMVKDVWGRVAAAYDIHVDPIEYLHVDHHRVVVTGRYWGTARSGHGDVDAAFAHIITTRDDRITALTQITDTRRWNTPQPDDAQ
ncbi:polyketide cyclase [Nocardia panacis]|uniref:Polyketide cyclase n=1 Tax=Nocardia panacis TaxID=2340916 RepID=A0A3A4KFP2_9NOCA|nr:nuclear transport factor 2 family protein [Nocardia panacis]RJO74738.1 polyketide cyclase [Nocardia panacis]